MVYTNSASYKLLSKLQCLSKMVSNTVVIVTRMDIMMISSLLDLEQVAFYTIAFFIGNALRIPSKAIVAISTPLLAKAWKEQDFNEINSIYSKSALNLLNVGGVFFTCVWINIDQIFSLLPEKFSAGKFVVFYIGLSQLFNISFVLNISSLLTVKVISVVFASDEIF